MRRRFLRHLVSTAWILFSVSESYGQLSSVPRLIECRRDKRDDSADILPQFVPPLEAIVSSSYIGRDIDSLTLCFIFTCQMTLPPPPDEKSPPFQTSPLKTTTRYLRTEKRYLYSRSLQKPPAPSLKPCPLQ